LESALKVADMCLIFEKPSAEVDHFVLSQKLASCKVESKSALEVDNMYLVVVQPNAEADHFVL
jgi:hypothetical protein